MAWDPIDPEAVLDYDSDWSQEVAAVGATALDTATWTIESGLTKVSDTISGAVAKVWLSAGTAIVGHRHACEVKVT